MSGLYNVVFGENEYGRALVELLAAIRPLDVGRYRDAWVERDDEHEGGVVIRVHTRNGGGNREAYAEQIESMRAHPWFVHDEDDDFDSTYADFYFAVDQVTIPKAMLAALVGMAQDPVDMGARWQAAIDRLGGR